MKRDFRPIGRALGVLLSCVFSTTAQAQDEKSPSKEGKSEALRVFLDCKDCDFDYVRTEITFVDYVRDRNDAELHVLVTTQPTGSGGTEFTIQFIGRERFSQADNLLRYGSSNVDTSDEVRRALTQVIKLALLRYVAETPLSRQIEVSHNAGLGLLTGPGGDPWKHWVFRSYASASFSGEQSTSSKSLTGSFSANRTTAVWKIRAGVSGGYKEGFFELAGGRTFRNVTRTLDVTGLAVKSVGDHWGVGLGGSLTASTFVNQDLSLRIAPAIEYNFFPYAESTRRQFTITYAVGANAFNYEEETLFGKTSETLPNQSAIVSLDMKQPWGSTSTSFEAVGFLHDPGKYRLVFYGSLDVRVRRGLSLSFSGGSSLIRDQLFLPKEGLTDEEILVKRRQLATSFQYYFSLGVTYTFGSIYNNVVNSRFAGSSGGIIRVF